MAKKKLEETEGLQTTEVKELKIKSKKTFSINDYKKNLDIKEVDYKEDEWIPLSRAYQDTTQLPGIPMYGVTMVYGHPDSGKSTLALEATRGAISCDILPIFINTEKKFNWGHAIEMGINQEDVLYVDSIEEVEDIMKFVRDRLRDQRDGVLPTDILKELASFIVVFFNIAIIISVLISMYKVFEFIYFTSQFFNRLNKKSNNVSISNTLHRIIIFKYNFRNNSFYFLCN
jgi:hypothetical protein